MINAYADQNFLSSSTQNPAWSKAIIRAKDEQRATLVLSPIHFLEVGKSNDSTREALLQFVEEVKPKWTYSQADMQKREFVAVWEWFWRKGPFNFEPIGGLQDVAAAMHNVSPVAVANFTLRDWVSAFVATQDGTDALAEIKATMDSQEKASAQNRVLQSKGHMTRRRLRRIDAIHVALQMARVFRDTDSKDVYQRAKLVLDDPLASTFIDTFIDWQGLHYLKCYQIETALTSQMWFGSARLNHGRQADRQHATVALPYCDVFVTNDIELTKRCEFIKTRVRFPTAQLITGERFINSL